MGVMTDEAKKSSSHFIAVMWHILVILQLDFPRPAVQQILYEGFLYLTPVSLTLTLLYRTLHV